VSTPAFASAAAARAELWKGAEDLALRAPDAAALEAHRLETFAARRLRQLNKPIPNDLLETERLGAAFALTARVLLERARAACTGPVLLLKGLEVAARYPDPGMRISRDVDLLVPDAPAVQAQLRAVGFEEVGDPAYYAEAPHLLPLAWPGLPMTIEVHDRPHWPRWLKPPVWEDVFENAAPSDTGVEGIVAPAPDRHALCIAAHAWSHGPLARARDLLDVLLLAAEADAVGLEKLAEAWGLGRLWPTTRTAGEALLRGGPAPFPLRSWARNLASVRERTVLESHAGRWLAGFSTLPLGPAVRTMLEELWTDARPQPGESWTVKLRRSRRAIRNAFVRKSSHDKSLGS
jgi:hypothetical protein